MNLSIMLYPFDTIKSAELKDQLHRFKCS